MTTFHCDKLCSCDACAPIRWALSYVESVGKPLGSYAAGMFRDSAKCTAAWWASRDPAKLAELMVMGLRARGLSVEVRRYGAHRWTRSTDVAIWYGYADNGLQLYVGDPIGTTFCPVTLVEFCAKLLAVMQTSPNESSREACERILRGEP